MFGIICICLAVSFSPGCDKLPFVPDESALIFLSANPSSIQAGQTATVLVMGEKASGYPLPGGTVVYLFCNTGQINDEVILIDGKAEALYRSDSEQNGDAVITARSGLATISPEELIITVIKIEEPDISYIFISANPMELPEGGGQSSIRIIATDSNMIPVSGKNIWIETTAGSLAGSNIQPTDDNGEVRTILNTDRSATVTARYKNISASVIVTIDE